MAKPRILFENDSRHTLIYMYEPPIQLEDHQLVIDELLGTPVEALVFNLGYGNAFLHATEIGDRWNSGAFATLPFRPTGGKQWEHVVFMRAYRNAEKLIAEGNDPLRIVCERAHKHNLLLYPSLQLNSALSQKELSIGGNKNVHEDFPGSALGDFRHQEVRAHRLALIEEVMKNYDVDGFELNLSHYAGRYFFDPAYASEKKRTIMSDFIARVAEIVHGSKPDCELAVRMSTNLSELDSQGLDPGEWARAGYIDVIMGESANGAQVIDPTANFGALLKCAEGNDCRIHGVLRNHVDSDRLNTAPIQMIRATASNYWNQGVTGLLCAHWFGNWPYGPEFYEQMRELPFPEVMAAKDKIYTIPTVTGRLPEPAQVNQLPINLEAGSTVQLLLPISDDLQRWQQTEHVHEVILRIRITRVTELDVFRFALNGRDLPEQIQRKINHVYQMSSPRFRSHPSYWFVFKLEAEHWPQQGDNHIEITLLERDPELTPELAVRDVELEVRYLRSKNYHRGIHNTDPDLGPFEHANT